MKVRAALVETFAASRRQALAILPAFALAAAVGTIGSAQAATGLQSLAALFAPYPFLAVAMAIFFRREAGKPREGSILPDAILMLAGYLLVPLLLGIVLFLAGSFLMVAAGVFVGASGADLSGAQSGEELVETFRAALTGGAWIFLALLTLVAGMFAIWLWLRLILWAPASIDAGRLMIFRTWGLTRGHVLKLVAGAFLVILLPGGLAIAAGLAIDSAFAPATELSGAPELYLSEGAFWLLQYPLTLLGLGYTAAAYRQIGPERPDPATAFE